MNFPTKLYEKLTELGKKHSIDFEIRNGALSKDICILYITHVGNGFYDFITDLTKMLESLFRYYNISSRRVTDKITMVFVSCASPIY